MRDASSGMGVNARQSLAVTTAPRGRILRQPKYLTTKHVSHMRGEKYKKKKKKKKKKKLRKNIPKKKKKTPKKKKE
eukprot:NODE_26327_length_554_cov_7.079625.p3 GENE.NODE_26327_length_554_cov_7.079625~~NODE_26327_length_554_cov_7.079625.p3  ORF type:complete len:76 (-),score=34.04 NODE_26327_length_554_cov_7.079625:36-263(-)